MPTVLRINGFRFFFYSNESNEPQHIHIEKADKTAKYWLDPIRLAENYGFSSKDTSFIVETLQTNKELFTKAWYEYFGK